MMDYRFEEMKNVMDDIYSLLYAAIKQPNLNFKYYEYFYRLFSFIEGIIECDHKNDAFQNQKDSIGFLNELTKKDV